MSEKPVGLDLANADLRKQIKSYEDILKAREDTLRGHVMEAHHETLAIKTLRGNIEQLQEVLEAIKKLGVDE